MSWNDLASSFGAGSKQQDNTQGSASQEDAETRVGAQALHTERREPSIS